MNCFKSENTKCVTKCINSKSSKQGVTIALAICFKTTLLTQIINWAMPTNLPMLMPSAIALPGQTPDQVAAWVKTNPALSPAIGERLLVRKSITPSRRFQFQASVLLPGVAEIRGTAYVIRSEQLHLFDIITSVTRSRLEETLRSIYGPEIMRDYATAKTIYAYPTADMLKRSRSLNASPILSALRGELRQGKQFAYWVELLQNGKGGANSGQITVLELESLPKLQQELSKK
jgi:gamma-glutamylcyclotransferase (GGCT)/AIG2-like uncharacterized protein YtfP